jgi:hypothetical protein
MPTPRFKLPKPEISLAEVRTLSLESNVPRNQYGEFRAHDDIRLPGVGLRFEWAKLQEIADDCRLIILNDRQIAWLEDMVGRLSRADYYRNPDYIAALWGIDTTHADWVDIQDFAEDVEVCLLSGCRVSDLNDTLKAINSSLSGLSGISSTLKQLQKAMAANNDCLTATEKAIYTILGGTATIDCGDTSVPTDCQAVASAVDALIEVLDWESYAVDMAGTYLNITGITPLVEWLVAQKWYITALGVAGLIDPADLVVDIPVEVVTWTTVAVEALTTAGVDLNKQIIDTMKANRTNIIDDLCGATSTDIGSKLDTVINLIKDSFTDTAKKSLVQSVLEGFLKSPVAEGVILTK